MITKIKTYIARHIDPYLEKPLLTDKPRIVMGLSGGPDSVCLLHVLLHLRTTTELTLTAAHLNHGWRDNAGDDEAFCKTLCAQHDVPFVTAHADNLDLTCKPNGSKEAFGRALRRHFFSAVRCEQNADYIALAHHQQDQHETFFLRLIRGCSLSGLVGMRPVQGSYIRPLLATSKKEILAYLTADNISYVIDQSNESDTYLRNRIRKYVIPALSQIDPRFTKKFASSLTTLTEENELLGAITHQTFEKMFAAQDNTYIGSKKAFTPLAPPLQKRIIVEWLKKERVSFVPSDAFLQEIMRFLTSNRGGTHRVGSAWSITKKQDQFWILHHWPKSNRSK